MLKSIDEIVGNIKQRRLQKADEQTKNDNSKKLSLQEEKRLLLLLKKFEVMGQKMEECSANDQKKLEEIISRGININNFPKPEKSESYAAQFKLLIDGIKSLEEKINKIELKPQINVPEVKLPKINVPEAKVKVSVPKIEAPKVDVKVDTSDLKKEIQGIKKAISEIKFEYTEKEIDLTSIVEGLKSLEKKILVLKPEPEDNSSLIEAINAVEERIANLRFPVPTPVTQFDMNPLRGVPRSTGVTVGDSATKLPSENLANRRSIIIYNADTENTLYIGGSNVSTTNGFPISPESYSPPIDAGSSMTLYGIATTNINVRVLEVSNDNIGSS